MDWRYNGLQVFLFCWVLILPESESPACIHNLAVRPIAARTRYLRSPRRRRLDGPFYPCVSCQKFANLFQ
jgi:hypothetical protein